MQGLKERVGLVRIEDLDRHFPQAIGRVPLIADVLSLGGPVRQVTRIVVRETLAGVGGHRVAVVLGGGLPVDVGIKNRRIREEPNYCG